MKTLLIGLLVLGSISAFSSSVDYTMSATQGHSSEEYNCFLAITQGADQVKPTYDDSQEFPVVVGSVGTMLRLKEVNGLVKKANLLKNHQTTVTFLQAKALNYGAEGRTQIIPVPVYVFG